MRESLSAYVFRKDKTYVAKAQFSDRRIAEGADPAKVLQAAIDAAGSGEVLVESGDYPLSRPILLRDGVLLRGRGLGTRISAGPGFEEDGRPAEETATPLLLVDDRKGVQITDIAVDGVAGSGALHGIIVSKSADCHIRNVFAMQFAGVGITIRRNTLLSSVESCSLAGNGECGILLHDIFRGDWGAFVPNLVTDCVIYGGGSGLVANRALVVNIVATLVHQTKGPAFHLKRSSNSVLINACRSYQITGDAVMVEDTDELNITGNIFCWHTGHGIFVRNSNWGTITGNNVIDTGSLNLGVPHQTAPTFEEYDGKVDHYDGIRLTNARGYSVSSNTIFNWGVAPQMRRGVYEDDECSRNIIANNNVNYAKVAAESSGKDSVLKDTVSFEAEAYRGMGARMQSFERHLTEKLISELRQSGAT